MPLFPTTNGTSHDVSAKRFMLITNPRTCSNLLVRILGLDKQPSTKHGQYHFLDCLLYLCTENLMEVDPADWTEEQRAKAHDLYKARIEALEKTATPDDEQHTKIIFTKEHVETILEPTTLTQYGQGNTTSNASPMRWGPGNSTRSPLNQTIFSDAYLDTWTPIFLVRHPARAFESIYRSFVDVMQTPMAAGTSEKSREVNTRVHMSLSWTRTLYEFYFSRGVQPVLIDADDLVLHTKPLTQRLAKFVGLDPDALQYTWQEATEAELSAKPAHMKRMLSSLDSSAGVKADQSKLSASFNVQKQMPRWIEEFGEQGAKDLRIWIEEAMPDYEFLHERRLRP